MSWLILLPLLYLAFGFAIGKSRLDIKGPASALLTWGVIPLVIIYNIATYPPGLLAVVLGVMGIMGSMALIGGRFTRDPIRNMCFFYLNIGWLGLPVATALFGDGAAAVFIAAYIGSTIFGNSIGAGMLDQGGRVESSAGDAPGGNSTAARALRLAKSPPAIAIYIGLVLLPFGDAIAAHGQGIYTVLKFLLGFIGMTILGIWLAASNIRLHTIRNELKPSLLRAAALAVLITVFVQICRLLDVQLVTQNLPAVYLICLLPPAANIVVLETHYRKTGDSARLIAAGTCISIVAICVYAVAVHALITG